MNTKIISWNVRGLGALERKAVVKRCRLKWKPSILILQETKLAKYNDVLISEVWGGREVCWEGKEAIGSAGGILFLWDPNCHEKLGVRKEGSSISILFKDKSDGFE